MPPCPHNLALLLVFAGLLPLAACRTGMPGGTTGVGNFALRERTWVRYDPTQPSKSPRPLLVALHGYGGTGQGMRRLTGLDAVAERHGFSVVYPDGLDKRWRDGRLAGDGVDDVAFVTELVTAQLRTGQFDGRRVYLTAMSNGSFMLYRLLCERTELFAAAAPVAGGMAPELLATCKPSKPLPLLVIQNTDDPLVPYAGGPVASRDGSRGYVAPTGQTLLAWRRWNGQSGGVLDGDACNSWSLLAKPPDGTRAVLLDFCGGTAPVWLARIEAGGHTWPGGRAYLPEVFIGKTSRAWSASEGMWKFFSAL